MSTNESTLPEKRGNHLGYSRLVPSCSFQQLLREKRHFIIPWAIFFLVFYFALPILTVYSSILHKIPFGTISRSWMSGTSYLTMPAILSILSISRAAKFDQTLEKIKHSISKGGA